MGDTRPVKITAVDQVGTSAKGNPTWQLTSADWVTILTAVDGAIGRATDSPEFQGPIDKAALLARQIDSLMDSGVER